METIGSQKIWSFIGGEPEATSNTAVRKSQGFHVSNYLDLAQRVSTLQYLNRDFVLMFRGQGQDFINQQSNTTLKATIYRGSRVSGDQYPDRFNLLKRAEDLLESQYEQAGFQGLTRLRRQRILRWSILQHYEVCPTPLLDVTHSLRIAASFASSSNSRRAFLYVLGLPNLSGAITASAEAGLQIVRLSSVCPPQAVRPHIQEGYLLGEYPDMDRPEQKNLYRSYEIDFGLRLIAKFSFEPDAFWENSRAFPPIPADALYPNAPNDPMNQIAHDIKAALSRS